MNINSMMRNTLINSYLSTNKPSNKFGTNRVQGFDMASINTRKLENIIASRTKQEANFNKQLNDFRSTSKEFYGDFYPKMNELEGAASKLKITTMDSVLKPMGYGSDNSNVVANVSGTLDSGKPISVDVSQLATKQETKFNSISATTTGEFTGKTTLTLDIGGKKTDMSVDATSKMTGQEALKLLADKVNSAKTGVTAEVLVKDGKAELSLSSDKTGEKAAFSAKVSGTASKALGEGAVVASRNAKYAVDGKEFSSETNKVKLADDKLSATLTGTGKANLGKQNIDAGNAVYAVKDFAQKYNDVVNFLSKNEDVSFGVKNMSSSFSNTKYLSNALSKVGIDTDSSGRLYVDEARFTSAMQSDPEYVNKIIGSAGGLAGETSQKAKSAIVNSSKLVEAPKGYNRFYGTPIGLMMDYRA